MKKDIYELSINNIDESKIKELVKIHNENFKNKVEGSYFKDILGNNLYTVYCTNCIIENTVRNIEENKITEKEEKISGYIIYYDTFSCFDLFEIAVDKEFQNRGIGNRLLVNSMSALFDNEKYENRTKEEKSILLEVNENNFSAIKLYRKNNFKEISVRKSYYGTGQNALIMIKSND